MKNPVLIKEVLPPCSSLNTRQTQIMLCVLVVLFCVISDALTRIS